MNALTNLKLQNGTYSKRRHNTMKNNENDYFILITVKY